MNGIEEFSQPSVHVLCSTLPSFSRIELPCFVQDSEKSLELLGGLSLVDSAIKDSNNVLHFTFPSENVNKTRIVASVVHKNGFLIKIRRKKTQGGAVAIESSSTVIGAVTKSFVFNNLADYEFLPAQTSTSTSTARAITKDSPVLDLVPHSFSRDSVNKGAHRLVLHDSIKKPLAGNRPTQAASSNVTNSSAVQAVRPATTLPANSTGHKASTVARDEDAAMVDAESRNIQESNSRNPDKGLAYFINIDDPVPLAHPRGEYPYDNERGVVLVSLLKKLFSIIPILSREQIETYLNLEGRVHLFKTCLPYVAYNLVKGPFRQMWVRYGYDPKEHPSSAIYQTIHFRVSPQVVQDITERIGKKVGTSVSRSKMVDLESLRVTEMPLNSVTYLLLNRPQQDPPIFAYSHVIKMQLVLQVFQLTDPMILDYLGSTKRLASFDNQSGWFSMETINTLRVMALKALPDRIHRFVSLSNNAIWSAGPAKTLSTSSSSASSSSPSPASGAATTSPSSRPYDAVHIATMLANSNFNVEDDAAQLGFDANSTGLFVVCNRTLNTLRAYMQSVVSSTEPASILADATTAVGEVNRDEVRTVDGIYLGKVLAWHRRYACAVRNLQIRVEGETIVKYFAKAVPVASASKAKKQRTTAASKSSKQSKAVLDEAPSNSAGAGAGAAAASAALSAEGGRGVQAFSLLDEDGGNHSGTSDSEDDSGSDSYGY